MKPAKKSSHQDDTTNAAGSSMDDKVEPIAVIGMSVRLPQGNHSTEAFWNTLMSGITTQSKVPLDRFDSQTFPHLPPGGHFIERPLDNFDAAFFSMASGEAEALDPLQRWLLETTYEAIENGKQVPLKSTLITSMILTRETQLVSVSRLSQAPRLLFMWDLHTTTGRT